MGAKCEKWRYRMAREPRGGLTFRCRLRAGRGTLNHLIMVRIHAPEPAFLSDRLDARNKVRNNSERWPGAAAGEVAVPRVATAADAVTPAAVSASIRADMRRALAEGLTRALAAGDDKAARVAIVALSALAARPS